MGNAEVFKVSAGLEIRAGVLKGLTSFFDRFDRFARLDFRGGVRTRGKGSGSLDPKPSIDASEAFTSATLAVPGVVDEGFGMGDLCFTWARTIFAGGRNGFFSTFSAELQML